MTGKEKLFFDENSIQMVIENNIKKLYVMHNAERSLMERLSDLSTSNGGNILEIGFGMGICSDRIQENTNVLSHTIIEVHPEIYDRALNWAKNKSNVNIILGDWINVLPTITDIKFDGVLHDTCMDANIGKLIDIVKPLCNNNCIVAFFLNKENKDLKTLKHIFKEDEFERLPYKNICDDKDKSYDLKYITINY
jgi:hypothetical protein